uniref:Temptin Cys/Cys disulfide domain-containing protein n=1 Tax=Magallana gigas TaxID=29159 RepID=A0A8W8J2Y0_MAGGI
MLEMWSLYLSVLSASLSVLCAWPEFVNKIPNGRSVPNPCGSEPKLWRVVGHQYATRSLFSTAKKRALTDPFLNVFGQMYRDNNYRWSDICDLDADGDGKSNGQELGDPDCVWKRGQEPAGLATGHPGICEDANNQVCADHPTASYCSASLPSLMAANAPNVNSQGEIPPPP